MKVSVVLVGYNRPASLIRLFESVMSSLSIENVDVVISLDYNESQADIVKAVKGSKLFTDRVKFRLMNKRNGLKNHILACGDLTEFYDAVVILEDDIVVSECFVDYVFAAIKYIGDDDLIGGISLYSPTQNEMSLLPFTAKPSGFDNYYLQSAQSWGQCWTRKMWKCFRDWYQYNSDFLIKSNDMPSRIYSWPESSWKKYYMKYLVDTSRTFFYPTDSYSTNCSDVGQHNKIINPRYQVPLVFNKRDFNFGSYSEVPNYDVFFERKGLMFNSMNVCSDIYGTKRISDSRYFLSSKKINAPVVRSFGLNFRPQEDNFIYNSCGNDIFLYDLNGIGDIDIKESYVNLKLANYYSSLSWKNSLVYGFFTLKERLIKKFKGA